MRKKQTSKKIAKEATISFAGIGIGNGLRYIFTALLARWVGAQYLGIYSIGNAITRLIEVFGKAGLDSGILRFVSKNPDDRLAIRKYIGSAIKMGLLFSLVSMLVLILISDWLTTKVFHGDDLMKTVLIVNAVSLPFSVLTIIAAFATQGFKLLKYKAIVTNILAPTVLLIVMTASFFFVSPEMAIILPLLFSAVVSFGAIAYFLRKLSKIHTHDILKAKFSKKLLKFSSPLMFVSIIGTFMHWMDVTMLGYFTDSESVGLYHPAARTSGLMRAALLALVSIYSPLISGFSEQGKYSEMDHLYKLTIRLILSLAVPFAILFTVFPGKVMLLFGPQYVTSANILIILTVGTLIQAFMGVGGPTLTMTGFPKVNLINSIITVIINFGLNITWIPKYGLIGAAWATTISMAVIGVLRLVEVRIFLGIQPFSLKLVKPLLAGIVAYIGLILLKPFILSYHTLVTLTLAVITILLLFVVSLLFLRPDEDDKEVIKSILNVFQMIIQRFKVSRY